MGGVFSDSSDKLFGLLLTFSFLPASRASLYRTVRAEQSHWWVSTEKPFLPIWGLSQFHHSVKK